ncbi:hypothetical protein JR316_0008990 [Psilocybe cubensis]|uniref:Uncharacterized protein n=2 Tax=Psilocybe cubensis TaxID=181762 RepID=A0ACB8GU65_PSICU|nr:hypothetical protein JR316_0008990 [Psilocybe cubensis]KAH9478535.1 hypothetical protein JR316_0008990 [Psilocybe cubensis]
MTILIPRHNMSLHPNKHIRRNATAVMAGAFDPRPPRDVLTSLLNGVGPYKEVERDEEARQKRKLEKKEQKREEKRKLKAAARQRQKELAEEHSRATAEGNYPSTSALNPPPAAASNTVASFWRARPTIFIPGVQRSVSVTPSPTLSPRRLASTPASTPGPSISSSTSRTSSKRPHTPHDDDEETAVELQSTTLSAPPRPRKKRAAAKKGWKGWVEGSPPPSDKLINLDAVPLLQERRTRSGKNFDGIGVGNQHWL